MTSEGSVEANHLTGSNGNDVISASSGNDSVTSYAGNDLINAGGDDDRIFAGSVADTIWGAADHDTLWGETGDDVLGGGTGNEPMNGSDQIGDFTAGSDRLHFTPNTGGGPVQFSDLRLSDTAEGLQITYDGGRLLLVGLDMGDLSAGDMVFG